MSPQLLLTEYDLANVTSLSVVSIRRLRYAGTGPKHVRIGRSVRYRVTDVEAWINSRPTVAKLKPKR